jgi:hypothetical protein
VRNKLGEKIDPRTGFVLGKAGLEDAYVWMTVLLDTIHKLENEKRELERQADCLTSSWKIGANSIKGTRSKDPKLIYIQKMDRLKARLEYEYEFLDKNLQSAVLHFRNLSDIEKEAAVMILKQIDEKAAALIGKNLR